ncbi:hypothetical protein RHO12_02970 [Orbus sturtevantii]|uniref:hypothetical protein n=1 Tax=Orbus sturtevantii TaxID=3074109 RepID=UPI00370D5AAB
MTISPKGESNELRVGYAIGSILGTGAGAVGGGALCGSITGGLAAVPCGTAGGVIGGIWGMLSCSSDDSQEQDNGCEASTSISISLVGGTGSPNDDDQDKYANYKGDLQKGDKVDLNRFSAKGKDENYRDPKTGWSVSPDRAGAKSHGGSAWKLLNKKGGRIGTLDSGGQFLRK